MVYVVTGTVGGRGEAVPLSEVSSHIKRKVIHVPMDRQNRGTNV